MKKEWIMSEEARLEKKQRIQENRERRAAAAAAANTSANDGAEQTEQQQQIIEHLQQQQQAAATLGLQPQQHTEINMKVSFKFNKSRPLPSADVLGIDKEKMF
jgi:outer membrane protein OmpA-like peptidoglycan-associated protein